MRTSLKGRKFIGRWEGLRLKPYNDPAGFATVGIGHLIGTRPVTEQDRRLWTLKSADEAYELLKRDLYSRDIALSHLVRGAKGGTTQAEFDALSSLQYNIGTPGLAGSTVLRLHRQGKKYRAGLAFLMWNKAGGLVLLGLSNRRRAERRLYRKGRYT